MPKSKRNYSKGRLTFTLQYIYCKMTTTASTPSPTSSTKGPVKKHHSDPLHRCPICSLPLCQLDLTCVDAPCPSMKMNFLKYKQDNASSIRRKESGWSWPQGVAGLSARAPEDEAVVSGSCGELFHKRCLLNFCSANTLTSGRYLGTSSLCPNCEKPLKYSLFQEIDIEGHRAKAMGPMKGERDFNKIKYNNYELEFKRDKELEKLREWRRKVEESRKKLSDLLELKESLTLKLPAQGKEELQEKIKEARKRREEKAWMESYAKKAARVIRFMQKETPQTMRLYLKEIRTRPMDEIPEKTPIPRILLPYLHQIEEDDYCLFALSQIVEPRPYPGTTSFRADDLILGILQVVDPELGQKLVAKMRVLGEGSLMEAYEALFPGDCLEGLREMRQKEQVGEVEEVGVASIKDADGKDLAITIMYMVDDKNQEKEEKVLKTEAEVIMAEKGSMFSLSEGEGIFTKESATTLVTTEGEEELDVENGGSGRKEEDEPSCQKSRPSTCLTHLTQIPATVSSMDLLLVLPDEVEPSSGSGGSSLTSLEAPPGPPFPSEVMLGEEEIPQIPEELINQEEEQEGEVPPRYEDIVSLINLPPGEEQDGDENDKPLNLIPLMPPIHAAHFPGKDANDNIVNVGVVESKKMRPLTPRPSVESRKEMLEREKESALLPDRIQRAISKLCLEVGPPSPKMRDWDMKVQRPFNAANTGARRSMETLDKLQLAKAWVIGSPVCPLLLSSNINKVSPIATLSTLNRKPNRDFIQENVRKAVGLRLTPEGLEFGNNNNGEVKEQDARFGQEEDRDQECD